MEHFEARLVLGQLAQLAHCSNLACEVTMKLQSTGCQLHGIMMLGSAFVKKADGHTVVCSKMQAKLT